MVFKKGKDGTWILKKKFTFASVVLAVMTIFAVRGMWFATTVAEVAVVMSAYATASGAVLMLVFAADVADKKYNGGKYNLNDDYYSDRYK